MDKEVIENLQLEELWQKYKVPIIFKIKEPPPTERGVMMGDYVSTESIAIKRMLSNYYQANKQNLSDDMSVIVTEDEYEENMLLLGASCVISYGSTMCFKPIQANIPTVIIRELGNVANFSDYHATISSKDNIIDVIEEWDLRKKDREDFLDKALAGSLDFSSTAKYVQTVKRIIDDYKEKNTDQ